jgi:peptidoglycan hydrolase CwlO-like protein
VASFVNLVHEATLKSYWRRKALWRFLRHAGVAESFLATWSAEESKRDFLARLFAKLPDLSGGQNLLLSLARDLAQQESFPDLEGWEDSERKLESARGAVRALRSALAKIDEQVGDERERHRSQERFRKHQEEVRRSKQTLETLTRRLDDLEQNLAPKKPVTSFRPGFTT